MSEPVGLGGGVLEYSLGEQREKWGLAPQGTQLGLPSLPHEAEGTQ